MRCQHRPVRYQPSFATCPCALLTSPSRHHATTLSARNSCRLDSAAYEAVQSRCSTVFKIIYTDVYSVNSLHSSARHAWRPHEIPPLEIVVFPERTTQKLHHDTAIVADLGSHGLECISCANLKAFLPLQAHSVHRQVRILLVRGLASVTLH